MTESRLRLQTKCWHFYVVAKHIILLVSPIGDGIGVSLHDNFDSFQTIKIWILS
jgi:hypothetical protein